MIDINENLPTLMIPYDPESTAVRFEDFPGVAIFIHWVRNENKWLKSICTGRGCPICFQDERRYVQIRTVVIENEVRKFLDMPMALFKRIEVIERRTRNFFEGNINLQRRRDGMLVEYEVWV